MRSDRVREQFTPAMCDSLDERKRVERSRIAAPAGQRQALSQ